MMDKTNKIVDKLTKWRTNKQNDGQANKMVDKQTK